MADFTAADVKKLRELTGAGMMDCKKALEENSGDLETAIEFLRVKGAAKQAKRAAERTASNGLVTSAGNSIVELNCETDFVAKNTDFQDLAAAIVAHVDSNKVTDREALLEEKLADGRTVKETIDATGAVIGEKLELGQVARFEGQVATYMHKRSADLPPQVGVLVEYTGDDLAAARGAAMQVAAMKAQYLTRELVPADVVENERRIVEATAREEGKPEAAMPKIIEGRVTGFFKDVVLLEQPSVQDQKKSVKAVLDEAGVTLTNFVRLEVGGA
ncbi:translation elongation factor Ts [Sporichthya sp.]|uniref:translation elongation factor Ts n=1 Tax=Sporichthya sp. TaxID=65475 RepID=UPI00183F3F2D|nr:translation elongation factor Ts [Sporichthya sp.]MBA3742986.1 elongation factor Ts [Sporichthya sp.]